MQPAISIIIPTYNTPPQDFGRCIRSLLTQTFDNFEVIVIDDGSTDEISSKIDETCSDARIKVIHTANNGVSSARNLGLAEACGEAVLFVDADDYVAPWMLEDLWNAYNSTGDWDTVCSYFLIPKKGETFRFDGRTRDVTAISPKDMQRMALCGVLGKKQGNGYLSPGIYAVLTRAELAKQITFPVGITHMEDTIWNLEHFMRSQRIAVLHEPTYAYCNNKYSASHRYSFEIAAGRIDALRVLEELTPENQREWLALRTLATYYGCCKSVLWDKSIRSLRIKIDKIKVVNREPVWNILNIKGISKNWILRDRIKRVLYLMKLVPMLIAIKGAMK